MGKSKIEWTDKVWNIVTGCTPIPPGCDNCYASRMAKRLAGRCGYPPAPHQFDVTLHPDRLEEPLKWTKPWKAFTCSMGDLFHKDVPFEFINAAFGIMALAQNQTFQVLTKRPGRALEWFNHLPENAISFLKGSLMLELDWRIFDERLDGGTDTWPLPNVWLGVTAENQQRADQRIPILLDTPAAVRFVSVEPMLGPVNVEPYLNQWQCPECYEWQYGSSFCTCCEKEQWENLDNASKRGIDWVICGGESGPSARLMHPDWARSLRDQCVDAGVPFFFKQHGEWIAKTQVQGNINWNTVKNWGCLDAHGKYSQGTTPWNGRQENPDDDYEVTVYQVGKHKAGSLLDGREWKEFPEVL